MSNKVCVNPTSTFGVESPLGKMYISICSQGVHSLQQCAKISDENFDPNLSQPVRLVNDSKPCMDVMKKDATDCVNWLNLYFNDLQSLSSESSNKRRPPLPRLCFTASDEGSFWKCVWLTLAENVGPGQTITYGSLAALVGNPGAARAVGTAMANNPFQLMVPCHRVIRSNASVGKYAFGLKNSVKLWLLKHEGATIDSKGNIIQKQ